MADETKRANTVDEDVAAPEGPIAQADEPDGPSSEPVAATDDKVTPEGEVASEDEVTPEGETDETAEQPTANQQAEGAEPPTEAQSIEEAGSPASGQAEAPAPGQPAEELGSPTAEHSAEKAEAPAADQPAEEVEASAAGRLGEAMERPAKDDKPAAAEGGAQILAGPCGTGDLEDVAGRTDEDAADGDAGEEPADDDAREAEGAQAPEPAEKASEADRDADADGDAPAGAPGEVTDDDAPSDTPGEPADDDALADARAAAAQAGRRFVDATRGAAAVGSRTVNEGISALRELSQAKRAHGEARERLDALERQIEDGEAQLAHRREVERDYDQIVAAQRAELADATSALDEATRSQATLEARRDATTEQLKRLKADNEQRLRPYKNLLESARSALDDAERAHGEARRALKGAQAQYDTASNNRDTRLSAANRNVDNAAARLQRLQDQLAAMKREGTSTANELGEMSGGVAGALAQLENARDDLARVTADAQKAVEIAQTHLYTQKTSLEEAERDLADAQATEAKKRDEYDKLRQRADAAERELADQVAETEGGLKAAAKEAQEAQARIDAAQRLLDEAEDIHAHPDVTEALSLQLDDDRAAAEAQQRQVEALADQEHEVRERTRHQRTVFVVAVAVIVVLVALMLWLVLG